MSNLQVIFVASAPRSGSTLLDLALTSCPGVDSCGELYFLPDRALREDYACTCGQAFSQCGLWQRVIHESGGLPSAKELDEFLTERDKCYTSGLWLKGVNRKDTKKLQAYTSSILRSFSADRDSSYIVDSSKFLGWAAMLHRLPGVDLHLVHLIRDPRGNAFSWTQSKKLRTGTSADPSFRKYSVARSTAWWLWWNYSANRFGPRIAKTYQRVRYEDFCQTPKLTIERIFEVIGAAVDTGSFVNASEFVPRTQHIFSGNPMRHSCNSGVVTVKKDTSWVDGLSATKARAIALFARRLMRDYGYPT